MANKLLAQEFNLVSSDKAVFIWAALSFIGYKQLNKFLIIAKLKTLKIYITALFVAHYLLQVWYKLVHRKVYATYIVIYVKVNGI